MQRADGLHSRAARYSERTQIEPRTLIVAGEHDLFTPLEWAQRQLRRTVDGALVVVPDGGHGVQAGDDPVARDAVTEFLLQRRSVPGS